MLDICSLQSLYRKQIGESSSSFDQVMHRFFEQHSAPSKDFIEEECVWHEPLMSEDKLIENWKRLLAVNILCDLAQQHTGEVAAKVRLFGRQPWNQSSQYMRALVALNHVLAKMPIPEVGPHLLESGAALIDLHEYCPWLSLPYIPYHFEFGLFLCLLVLSTQRQDLREVVLRLANWQLNTLDGETLPLSGLFVREQEGKPLQQLYLSYLFFRGAACVCPDTPFAAVAQRILHHLEKRLETESEKVDPLWLLIEKWLEQHKVLAVGPLTLSEQIADPSTALAGYRSPSQHVICTLHGEHTGLGSFRCGEVEIVSYGPQYLPLGDCLGFGIEGNALTDQGMRRSSIEWRRKSFVLKGCTRLVDQPSSSSEMGQFRGIWLEVSQEFKRPHFYLKTTLLGLDGWDSVAFSFFVKAASCRTHSQQVLLPRTLNRYEGKAQTLLFEGQDMAIELQSSSFPGTMQVIPLGGGHNFWGADFLVAYLLSPDQRHYQWQMKRVKEES
jgi:hypothetical protein